MSEVTAQFSGIWIPIITPFRSGEIDFAALHGLVNQFIAAKISGLVVCGTTGEAAALSDAEQLAALDAVLDAVAASSQPALPVVMGLAGNQLQDLLTRLRHIQQRPIAGLLIPPPYYIRPAQAGLLQFFQTLADASATPLILYNIPYRTGVAMELHTILTLAEHPRIVAIKDCGGSLTLTMQLISSGKLAVLAGEDQQILANLTLGGSGAISAAAHIRPDLFIKIAEYVRQGNLNQARALFYCLLPLITLLFSEPNPAPLKALLAHLGHATDELREPMTPASPALRMQLVQALEQIP